MKMLFLLRKLIFLLLSLPVGCSTPSTINKPPPVQTNLKLNVKKLVLFVSFEDRRNAALAGAIGQIRAGRGSKPLYLRGEPARWVYESFISELKRMGATVVEEPKDLLGQGATIHLTLNTFFLDAVGGHGGELVLRVEARKEGVALINERLVQRKTYGIHYFLDEAGIQEMFSSLLQEMLEEFLPELIQTLQ